MIAEHSQRPFLLPSLLELWEELRLDGLDLIREPCRDIQTRILGELLQEFCRLLQILRQNLLRPWGIRGWSVQRQKRKD